MSTTTLLSITEAPIELPIETVNQLERIMGIQSTILHMLTIIDGVCREHNIGYYLYAGTLLGAVRHHGFIPWDDDADICMKRADYDKFTRIWHQKQTGLDLECYLTDKTSKLPFGAKIRMPGTIQHETCDTSKVYFGTWIDIFVLDNVSDYALVRQLDNIIALIWSLSLSPIPKKMSGTWRNAIANVLFFPPRIMYSIIPNLGIRLFHRWLKRHRHPTGYIAHCAFRKSIVTASVFADAVYVDFCGHQLPIPVGWHAWLYAIYDDYMLMPPVCQRRAHHII